MYVNHVMCALNTLFLLVSFSYGRILSAYPALIVGAVGAISLTCLLVVFTTHSIPDFSDPQLVSFLVIACECMC
jgi:hypothetical protein